jgi:hypothetical protein
MLVKADHLNKMVDPLNRIIGGVGLPGQVQQLRPAITQQFLITAIQDEYLDCLTLDDDGSIGVETIRVMRPWDLRAYTDTYSRDGKTNIYVDTQTRTQRLNNTSTTERQFVTPDYYTGNVITATRGVRGGVIGDAMSTLTEPMQWIDDNRAGRAWAAYGS